MKMHSRITAAILSLIMIISALPLAVFANSLEYSDSTQEYSNADGVKSNDISDVSIISEVVSKRTEREKHFKLSNGTYLAVLYNQPVHKQSNGCWIEVEDKFEYENEFDASDGLAGYIGDSGTLISKISSVSDGALVKLTDNLIKKQMLLYDVV